MGVMKLQNGSKIFKNKIKIMNENKESEKINMQRLRQKLHLSRSAKDAMQKDINKSNQKLILQDQLISSQQKKILQKRADCLRLKQKNEKQKLRIRDYGRRYLYEKKKNMAKKESSSSSVSSMIEVPQKITTNEKKYTSKVENQKKMLEMEEKKNEHRQKMLEKEERKMDFNGKKNQIEMKKRV